ncbi:hypothetical protein ACLOJK_007914 [Asimina triloba]
MAFLPAGHCCRLDLSHHGRCCNEEDDLLGVTAAGSASASGAETGLHGCWYVCPDPEQRRLTILFLLPKGTNELAEVLGVCNLVEHGRCLNAS